MTIQPEPTDEQRHNPRRERLSGLTLAGVGGLALFGDLAKDTFADAGEIFRALFITLVLLAGGCAGRAYAGLTNLSFLKDADPKWVDRESRISKYLLRYGSIFLFLAGTAFLLTAWWSFAN